MTALAAAERPAATAPAAPIYRLHLRRVFVFPTRHGWTLIVLLVLMLLSAINYDNALVYALTFLLSGIILVTVLRTWRGLAGLGCLGISAVPVFAGTDACFRIALDNRGQPERRRLRCRPRPRRERWWRRRKERAGTFVDIAADTLTHVEVAVPAPRRGIMAMPPMLLETVYPLGLVRAWAYLDVAGSCVVYPRPAGDLPVPADTGRDGPEGASDNAGREDFAGLRAFQPGDAPRAIAWKVLARSDDLLVKRFSGAAAPVWLDWQDTAPLRDTEARLSQLARWVIDADRAGQPWGLRLPGLALEPGTGARDRALTALAAFDGA